DSRHTSFFAIIDSLMKKVVHAACPHDCPDACGVLITVEDGRATKIQGDPEHPVTRGFLCAKVAKYLDRVYSPDRVLYPMRRRAPKGTGGIQAFERITWDEALDEISKKFRQVSAEFGSEAILPFSYGGTLGTLNGSTMDRRFFHRLGASQLDRTICSTAGEAGILSVQGAKYGTEPEQFRHSKYIIAWAANIHGNNVHLWPFIEEARRNGAKLVVIDPYRTRTARCADWYIPIAMGTDVALALGMMNVIISESLYDADYVSRYAVGFEQLRERAKEYTPDKVAAWTGIPAEDIRLLAREYATTRPAVIRLNYGIQRGENGGMATRAVTMLPVLTGSWKEVGGGLQMSVSGAFELNTDALKRPDLMETSLGRPARVINMVKLGEALTVTNDPPVKAIFIYNSNPAAVCPDRNKVTQGLSRNDLFTVVHEQFLTDTTDYADIVLPATTFFEHDDLQKAYGHYYLQTSTRAIAALGECRSNVDVFRALAERMGFGEPCFRETPEQMIDTALQTDHPWMKGITRERLDREKHVRLSFDGKDKPFLPFADGKFPTASGKAELYSEALKAKGLDPVVSFIPPSESRHTDRAKRYPLEMLARKADNFLNSTFSNLPSHKPLENGSMGVLEIAPDDARSRGVNNGDTIRVFNDRGSLELVARISDAVQPGTVSARLQWAKLSRDKKNVNVLTSDRLTDLGDGPTFYSTLVEFALA
ncbi:MAG TPA: molybdopterin-dependent oxidoreductase, partial [Terriglobales bacterium]|nr:molybdopterin-dependent oxidoreductase [Terriglobales bacterium]